MFVCFVVVVVVVVVVFFFFWGGGGGTQHFLPESRICLGNAFLSHMGCGGGGGGGGGGAYYSFEVIGY